MQHLAHLAMPPVQGVGKHTSSRRVASQGKAEGRSGLRYTDGRLGPACSALPLDVAPTGPMGTMSLGHYVGQLSTFGPTRGEVLCEALPGSSECKLQYSALYSSAYVPLELWTAAVQLQVTSHPHCAMDGAKTAVSAAQTYVQRITTSWPRGPPHERKGQRRRRSREARLLI